MQKSGSAYFYNVINEILIASGSGTDARVVKQSRNIEQLMRWHNNNIGKPTLFKLIKLIRIAAEEGPFVVKTHAGPNLSVRILARLGLLRIVYCYRDPRDALLSAIDHGRKILDQGEKHTFASMVNFDKGIKGVKAWLRTWKRYTEISGVMTIKYEEMMDDPVAVTKEIEKFLEISVDPQKRRDILWGLSKDNIKGDRQGMHFNKATTYRYKTEMTDEQKGECSRHFGKYLELMGYDS